MTDPLPLFLTAGICEPAVMWKSFSRCFMKQAVVCLHIFMDEGETLLCMFVSLFEFYHIFYHFLMTK